MATIYLDVCCLNRPFDDQTQARIHLEAEAILFVLDRCHSGEWEWFGSEVLSLEISHTPDSELRRRLYLLASHVHRTIMVGEAELARAQRLEAWGLSAFDALHLACAESGGADSFLTTDDRLLRKAMRHGRKLKVRVKNPLPWLQEVS